MTSGMASASRAWLAPSGATWSPARWLPAVENGLAGDQPEERAWGVRSLTADARRVVMPGMVGGERLELSRVSPTDPKSVLSANFSNRPRKRLTHRSIRVACEHVW